MNFYLSGIFVFSLMVSAMAKPGEIYVLTGHEKSIFGIFQADLKAYPELYKGEDFTAYYSNFKTVNNLDERKLTKGEELIFPHTAKSKEILQAEKEKAAIKVNEAEGAVAEAWRPEAAAAPEKQDEGMSLFGYDKPRSRSRFIDPEEERVRAEAARRKARHQAVHYYQHTLLPRLLQQNYPAVLNSIEQGNIEELVSLARNEVDEPFSKALVLHRYPEKEIYILEFEQPNNVKDCFFLGIKKEASGLPGMYLLEKGSSLSDTGNASVLFKRKSDGAFTKLGDRKYSDLSSFLQEIDAGRPVNSDHRST